VDKKPKPIAWEQIPGFIEWRLVRTDVEGKVFYFNSETKQSVWEVPPELKEVISKMEIERKEKGQESPETKNGEMIDIPSNTTTTSTKKTDDDESSEDGDTKMGDGNTLDRVKRKLGDLHEGLTENELEKDTKRQKTEDSSEDIALKKDLTHAERVEIFKELLRDSGSFHFQHGRKNFLKLYLILVLKYFHV